MRRRAFSAGFRAGRRHRAAAVREVIDSELKRFEERLDTEQKHFEDMLASATARALHRLQSAEDAALSEPPQWLQ